MRLLSFAVGDYTSFGAVNGDGDANESGIVDLGRLLGAQYPTLGSVLRGGELHRAVSLGTTSKATISLQEVRYLPTVTDPEKIICIGINYGNRNEEYKDGAEAPKYPSVFMRTPGSLVGHLEPILNPPESNQLDYEGEIVLVIGKAGRRIAAADAWEHVAGLTLMNEGSVRDWLRHSKFNVTPGKNFEGSGSLGPWLVTADEIQAGIAAELHLTTRVNGELRQDDTTANLIFPFARLIEYLSSFMRLTPGDLIATGTPTGAGARFDPPKYLRGGDTVEVHVPELGTLRNVVVDEARAS
jgi:2-keto-4-pentenoate hydratase/2-oxohepta-3-ene-1,7-dioic acid hydratase in catechol pathway